jgi:hypothetical protein
LARIALGTAFGWVLAGFIALSCTVPARGEGPASSADEGELTFCHFGPKLKVLFPADTGKPGDKCTGNAKVQVLQWDCVPPEKAEKTVEDLRKALIAQAAEACTRHCANRTRDCIGKFDIPPKCGLGTDREDATILGKRFGCRSDCSGGAFAYCALYNSGFKTVEPELMAKQAPNCHCVPQRKP